MELTVNVGMNQEEQAQGSFCSKAASHRKHLDQTTKYHNEYKDMSLY